ncbi:MAG: DUF3857 domain-containing protein [Opitutaceae bacterium]|jgi:transglutaminase-like putative cysteine protease
MRAVRALLCLVFLAAAAGSFAAEADRYAGPEWALLEVPPVLQAAAGVTAAHFPDCDEVIVDEKTMEAYRPDGTGENQDETFTKVLTEKGRRDNTVLQLGFLLPYFKVEVSRLEVIKPDGKVRPVDITANAKESINNSQMAENIYDPDSRILQVNIPGVEIGDIVHSVTHTLVRRPIMAGEYSDEYLLEGRSFILHTSCEIHAPAARPLRHVELRDPVKGTVVYTTRTASEGGVIHHWEINRVPRMYDEPSMPPDEMVLQRVLVSTLPDWAAVSKWYWNLSQAHLAALTPDIKQTVAELTAGAKTDEEKIDAVFQYVSANIRYMGVTPEKDRPGFEPHDVKLTFAKKYGVCRDKAALLVAMLKLAGEQAYPVLINVGVRLDAEVPDPFFNHAIVAVESAPGRYVLMDPTDEHTRDLLPGYDDNQSYLVCRPEGDTLRRSPVVPPAANMMRIATIGTLSRDGALTATATLDFNGVNDDEYRNAFAQMKPDDRRRFFAGHLQRILPGAQLTSLQITPDNILDESAPLRAEIAFSVPGLAGFGGHKAVLTMPWIGRSFGVANFILNGTGLDQRKYPLETQVTCGVSESIKLKLDPNFAQVLSLPAASEIDNDCLAYRRHFESHNGTVECARELGLKVVEFSPDQYLELKKMLRDVAYDERTMPVVATILSGPKAGVEVGEPAKLPAVESNAKILQDQQTLTVTDAHHAVLHLHYVKRILTYEGKTDESEVKIGYNPATQEARIVHATVISPSGQRQEVSADETNVMDADWNASAKRYTGGKILVDSLPGVEIGSTIDVECELTSRGAPYLAGFQSFQLPDETDQKSFEIAAPTGVRIETRQGGPAEIVKEDTKTSGGSQVFDWQARQVAPIPQEPGAPPDWAYQAGVGYYVGEPADYWRELDATMLERAKHASKARLLAQKLVAHASTPLGAVWAIRDYVVETVRLAGPSFTELPLSELSEADTTLADGYGDQADRAILLYAMLTAAGLTPQYVLASDLPPVTALTSVARTFPLPDSFQTPLVRVEVDGQTYYLNDTDQYDRLGSTPHDDRLALVLGSNVYDTIEAAPNCRSRIVTDYTLTIADNGNARLGVRQQYYGMNYGDNNRRFSEMRPEERARYFQELVSSVAQGAQPVGRLTTNFVAYPGIEEYTVDVDRYGIAAGKYFYFDLPPAPRLFAAETDRRTLPLFLTEDDDDIVRTKIVLPKGFGRVVIAPPPTNFKVPDGAGGAQISSTEADGEYNLTYELDRRPAIIRPADYPAALATESALENKAARVILLERGAPEPAPNADADAANQ